MFAKILILDLLFHDANKFDFYPNAVKDQRKMFV